MMKNLTVFAVFILLGICVTSAQVPGFFGCPNPKVKKDFKVERYRGVWYEIERYFPIFFELGTKCGKAIYSKSDKPGHIKVENKGINRFTGKVTGVIGDAYAKNASEPAKLTVSFPSASVFATGPYWVLETDYRSFSIVYSCEALSGIAHADIIWILGREKSLPDDVVTMVRAEIEQLGLRTKFLVKQDQSDCDNLHKSGYKVNTL